MHPHPHRLCLGVAAAAASLPRGSAILCSPQAVGSAFGVPILDAHTSGSLVGHRYWLHTMHGCAHALLHMTI